MRSTAPALVAQGRRFAESNPFNAGTPTDDYIPPSWPGPRTSICIRWRARPPAGEALAGPRARDGDHVHAQRSAMAPGGADRPPRPAAARDRRPDQGVPDRRLLRAHHSTRRAVRPRRLRMGVREHRSGAGAAALHPRRSRRRRATSRTSTTLRSTESSKPLRSCRGRGAIGPTAVSRSSWSATWRRRPRSRRREPRLLLGADRLPALPARLRHRPRRPLPEALTHTSCGAERSPASWRPRSLPANMCSYGGNDPARRRRFVLRVGRAARRSTPARPAGDRRRRRRAGGELRGEGVRRSDGDGWPRRRDGSARTPLSSRPGCPRTRRQARRCSGCSRTRRRWSRGSRSTRRSSTSAACVGSPAAPAEIAARLRRDVRERVGLPITVGVARTKFLAKVASGVAKPDGLLVVPPEGELAFLHPLPVERLWGVGPKTATRLHDRGIRTVGQVAQLTRRRSSRCSAAPRAGTCTRSRTTMTAAASGCEAPARVDRVAARARAPREGARRDRRDPARARRARHAGACGGRSGPGARSCCGCASTTSRAPHARTRSRAPTAETQVILRGRARAARVRCGR